MPDFSGKLAPEEEQQVSAWLDAHWPQDRRDCPVSGPTDWGIHSHVVYQQPFHPQLPIIQTSHTAFPVVIVYCKTCGYARYFSAGLMGLLPLLPEGS